MSNPNNLIRPAVLSQQNPSVGNPTVPTGLNQDQFNQLQLTLLDSLKQLFLTEGKTLVNNIINPSQEFANLPDQTIDVRYSNNLEDLEKVPDVVKSLREFSGKHAEFSSWKKSIERVLNLYDKSQGTPKYYAIILTIRNKIVGEADAALEAYNTPLEWKAIAACLNHHYGDQRDLKTLEYQLLSLAQGNLSINDFYQSVYSHLTLILNKISCMEASNESIKLLTQTYREKALDTFVRGLKGDLPRLLGVREPKDLPHALYLCQKLDNQTNRNVLSGHHARNSTPLVISPKRHIMHQSPRPFAPHLTYSPQYPQKPQFIPNFMQRQQPNFNQRHFQQNGNVLPPRPPKPMSRPEPMEIDASLRTKQVNYMNRPTEDRKWKMPPTNQLGPPNKIQRNYHIQTQPTDHSLQQTSINHESGTDLWEEENQQYQEDQVDSTTVDFEDDIITSLSDIHFLE